MTAFRLTAVLVLLGLVGCSSRANEPEQGERVRLWHTFSAAETEELNRVIAESGQATSVEVTMLTFARGQVVLRDIFESGQGCPDLVRIDGTWLPGLAPYLTTAPEQHVARRKWLPEALELIGYEGKRYGLPQSIDGLALIARRSLVAAAGVAWPPKTVADLREAARSLRGSRPYGIDTRIDAYWFLAFLRASGGDLLDPFTGELGIDTPAAAAALREFAAMFSPGGIAPAPAAAGHELREELRRFHNDRVAIVIEGPWAIAELAAGKLEDVTVAALPGQGAAPRGGQLFVVPKCAKHPADGWSLAAELTSPAVQIGWGTRFGVVPTTESALAGSIVTVREFYAALEQGRRLPQHAVTPELFDDLTPAIAAVVAGDATAEEALAGVARAWRRIRARHQIPEGSRP